MSIFLKLLLSFAFLNILILGMGFFSSKQIDHTASFINEVYEKPLQSINFARLAQNDFSQLELQLYKATQNYALDEDTLEEIDESLELFTDDLEIAAERAISVDGKAAITNIETGIAKWNIIKNQIFAAKTGYDSINPTTEIVQEELSNLVEFEATAGYDFVIDIEGMAIKTQKQNTITSIIVAVFGMIIALFLAINLTRPIKLSVEYAQSISQGNFDNDITTTRKDEIGKLLQALSVMQTDLVEHIDEQNNIIRKDNERIEFEKRRNLLDNIAKDLESSMGVALGGIKGSIGELTTVSVDLSSTAQQSLSQSEETSNNMEYVGENIKSVAEEAKQLSESIVDVTMSTKQSSTLSEQASSKANDANNVIIKLSESAEEIGSVLGLINNIAEQINLLALNATIEAARAGEAGKGFAVVAAEVKNLANQTGSATDDIKEQVTNVQDTTKKVVLSIRDILSAVDEVQGLSGTIEQAVSDQSTATSEISRMVDSVSIKTDESVDNINDVRELSNSTKKHAQKVDEEMQNLSAEMINMQTAISDIATKIKNA